VPPGLTLQMNVKDDTIKNAWFSTCDHYQEAGKIARVFGAIRFVNDWISSSENPLYVGRDPISSDTYTHWDHTKE